jgi:hypothetical protein
MRDLAKDAQRVMLAVLAGFVLYFVLWGGVPFGLGFLTGRFTSPAAAAIVREIHTADTVVITRTDTVTKYQRRVDTVKARSDALDSLVVIRDDSSAIVADTVAIVPPEIIADLRGLRLTVATQDTLIRALYARDTTRQWQLATRDKLIRELSKPKCGKRCGLVVGFTAGILIHKVVK